MIRIGYRFLPVFLVSILLLACQEEEKPAELTSDLERPEYALVIHGGAGSISSDGLSAAMQERYTQALNAALDAGEEVLKSGGAAMEAVQASIMVLENDSLFNAGRGAVFTHEERNELDASIMDGQTMKAGAIAGVQRAKNPILGARAVMDHTKHVLLSGEGAEEFLMSQGLEMVAPDYFRTTRNLDRVREVKMQQSEDSHLYETPDWKYGTVGAVALDKDGHIAAGTSTGGMTNKRWNRIGDSPIIGAGTYADDNIGGVSCTGHGEYYIRYAVAYDLIAKMKYAALPLETAAKTIIHEELPSVGGSGGLIALDKNGNVSMEFNTNGMFRGYVKPNEREVAMFGE